MIVKLLLPALWMLMACAVLADQSADNQAESAQTADCQLTNPALQAMRRGQVTFTYADGKQHQIAVRIANNNVTRAAGFQRVCASSIAELPILFVFPRSVKPSFHMNNVVAPLAIAFIKESGQIDSVMQMQPYVLGSRHKPLYSPDGKVIAALETEPEFFSTHAIDQSARIDWVEQEN